MFNKEHWDIHFKSHKYPCFITDKDSKELLYFNNEFKKITGIEESKLGTGFFDVIDIDEVHIANTDPDWDKVDYFETESYNKRTHRKFTLKSTKMESGTEILCEMVPKENSLYDNVLFEKAVGKCMAVYEGEDEKVLPELMRLVAEFYNSERAYIYRFNTDVNTITPIAQWCRDDFEITYDASKRVETGEFIEWLQSKNNAGIVTTSNRQVHGQSSVEQDILENFNLRNVTLCNIEDANHKVIGLIGVSNRQDEGAYFDRRLIHTVSRLVSQQVAKESIEADMFEMHHRDLLTGCYNRTAYAKLIDQIMLEKPESMGVISVNVNGLRRINEIDGIEQGDAHIKKSAKSLMKYFGIDFFRMSGHEFLGVIPNISFGSFEDQVAALHAQMRQDENYDFSLGHSWTDKNINVMKLSNEAEKLMYINKQLYYAVEKRTSESMKNAALIELLHKIEEEQFVLYLQPQVWLKDGALYGAEALVRTYDTESGEMVFPDKFIPMYEDKAVIRHLDMFVLESVCKLQQKWIQQGKEIPVSVNFSRVTLQEYGIVDVIADICEKYQVPHRLVVVEITERVGLINNTVASVLVQKFKDRGFNLSLDDFGCAYSNLITLAQIEVDEVKIDKSLVDFIISNEKNRLLVKSILDMCEGLQGTATVAEGIENQEQSDMLRELGCGLGQGYHYSKPIAIEEFEYKYIK